LLNGHWPLFKVKQCRVDACDHLSALDSVHTKISLSRQNRSCMNHNTELRSTNCRCIHDRTMLHPICSLHPRSSPLVTQKAELILSEVPVQNSQRR
jgi:hypothetical protein